MSESLHALFQPRHVVVIGASRTPGKSGHSVVRNLTRCGFTGRVTPVNPAGGTIEGLPCAPTLEDVEGPIDCAMVVVPAAGAVQAVRDCAARGVRSAIIGSSGFAETNTEEGRARQADLAHIARDAGMRLLGPNTNGLYNASDAVSIGYNAAHADVRDPGSISVVSHSGALFGGVLNAVRQLGGGLAKFVPVGNEADIEMLDVLEYLIADPATRVIGLIIEALRDAPRLRELAGRAHAADKPIVALKIGRSSVGVGAALAHSSRLAGSARAYDALFHACGIAGVQSIEALAGGCAVLAASDAQPGRDRRLIAVTTSGAGGALLADAAALRGIPLAGSATGEWQGMAGPRIAALPARGWLRNPIDMGSLQAWSQLDEVYAALEQDGLDGPTAAYAHVAPSPDMDRALVASLAARRRRTNSPLVLVAPGGLTPEIEAAYRAASIPVFHDTGTCFDSLACHYHLRAPDGAEGRPAAAVALPASQGALSELESATVLRAAGIPIVASAVVRDAEDAVTQAARLGYPVVLKALAHGVAHKNDAGLVQVGLADAAELRRAHATLADSVAALGQDERTTPFILQPMLKSSAELILGSAREAELGHFIVIGLGGIHAELLDQVMLFPVPSSVTTIRETLLATPLGRLLLRLGGEAVLDQVVAAASCLQGLLLAQGDCIASVDINPLLVTDRGCQGVDALIVLEAA